MLAATCSLLAILQWHCGSSGTTYHMNSVGEYASDVTVYVRIHMLAKHPGMFFATQSMNSVMFSSHSVLNFSL